GACGPHGRLWASRGSAGGRVLFLNCRTDMRGCFGLYAGETGGNAVSLGGPLPPLCVPAGVPYRCRDMSHGYVPRRVASAARTTTWPLRSSTAGTVAVCWSHYSDRRSARRWLTS